MATIWQLQLKLANECRTRTTPTEDSSNKAKSALSVNKRALESVRRTLAQIILTAGSRKNLAGIYEAEGRHADAMSIVAKTHRKKSGHPSQSTFCIILNPKI
jgi:hypothetical protein